jgi:hypothetical protein
VGMVTLENVGELAMVQAAISRSKGSRPRPSNPGGHAPGHTPHAGHAAGPVDPV